jgi:hypothetical protein
MSDDSLETVLSKADNPLEFIWNQDHVPQM